MKNLLDSETPEPQFTDEEKIVDEFIGILDDTTYKLIFAANNLPSRLFPKERQAVADAVKELKTKVKYPLYDWLINSVKDKVHLNPSWLRT